MLVDERNNKFSEKRKTGKKYFARYLNYYWGVMWEKEKKYNIS